MAVTSYNPWADVNRLNIDPFQWIRLYDQVEFCVTDRFHGAVFSILRDVPFLAFETSDNPRSNKLHDLLADFNLLSRLVDRKGSINDRL